MMKPYLTLLLPMLLATFRMPASDNVPSVLEAAVDRSHGLWQTAELAYANPAVNQWRLASAYTEGHTVWEHRKDSRNPDPRQGSGGYLWTVGAVTYTRYKSSTLWGDASYSNGKTRSMVWRETADADLLYPYLMADSIGGDLSQEQYRFHGGYADHRGRWAWGVDMAYTATLQYRSVDPRPRNVVGLLEITAGGMVRLWGEYYGGVMVGWQKYKQDNEVTFKSEMGVDKIFHLTGLGTDYTRFAGTGLSSYYNGTRFLAGLNLYPADGRGLFASVQAGRFSFTNILSDLNKLPLATARHHELRAQAGWLLPSPRHFGALAADLTLYRRHGSETQFGDAASSVYPVIGSNEMYADNAVTVSLTGRWGIRFGPVSRFHVELRPGWSHRTEAYVEPYSYKETSRLTLRAALSGMLLMARSWMLDADLALSSDHPYGCRLSLPEGSAELRALAAIERAAYSLESHRSSLLDARLGVARAIGTRYAAGLSAAWSHMAAYGHMSRNQYDIKIYFLF